MPRARHRFASTALALLIAAPALGCAPKKSAAAPAPTQRVEVPVAIRHGVVLVPVRIDGLARELTMLLDTGAPTVLRTAIAEELGLVEAVDTVLIDPAGHRIPSVSIELAGVHVGALHMRDVAAFAVDLPELGDLCLAFDGILGVGGQERTGFLDRTAIEIDYAAQTIALAPSADELSQGGSRVPVRRESFQADGTSIITATSVEIEIEGHRVWATLDTGNSGPLDLDPGLFLALGRSLDEPGLVPRRGALSRTAGGVSVGTAYGARVRSLRLGDMGLRGVPITVEVAEGKVVEPDIHAGALLGYHLLRNFRIVLDLTAGFARFIPVRGADPSAAPRGLGFSWLDLDGKIIVVAVVDGGPAQRAGIELFDEFVELGGATVRSGDSAGQCAVRDVIDGLGDEAVVLRLRRDGVERDASLRAEPLLPDTGPARTR